MEPSKEAIAVRIARLNRMILNKVSSGTSKYNKRTLDREALLDALSVLYDECNDDPVKKSDELVRVFVDKYRSTLADMRRTRVCISDFEMLQTIGRGYFGEVHMVREKETCDVYAMKTLRKEQARKRAAGAPEDERDVLATAAGPWIPKLQYAFQDNNNLYLVMELCNGGDLAGLLARRNTPLNEKDAAFYIAEVAHSLKALHALGYVHRDVKPHNILLDRCGHVKLGDFGSCARLSEGACSTGPVGTADYVAPELLAAAECASRHAVCSQFCRGIVSTAISACDYWSLGVVAFELVTLRRPFSTGDDDSLAHILANIHKYERDPESKPPFDPPPHGPSEEWVSLVAGLLRVAPPRRYNYLDTLQHSSLQHLSLHNIRDQAPPWVPCVRGAEDASYFSPPPRVPVPPSAAPFRPRPPFAGQLPFIGYSYVAPEEHEDSISSFSSSHDCTAINLATFKSAEKLAAMRAREIASLQSKLAAAEAAVGAEAERTRRTADAEAERQRARLQAEITALSLQNRRLERQVEVEKEERMALERSNQDLRSGVAERTSAELRAASAQAAEAEAELTTMRSDVRRLEERVAELQAECARGLAEADAARAQQKHYKNIIEHAQQLRHRRLTEINVRAIDTIAKERALRRQTLSGSETDFREATTRANAAEANAAKEARAREQIEMKLTTVEAENATLQNELRETRRELVNIQKSLNEKQRASATSSEQVLEAHKLLADERSRVDSLLGQIQALKQELSDAEKRETAMEEQCSRTAARFDERLEAAESRTAAALREDARHCQKVTQLEQLVRQLEREVSALEGRPCAGCESRAAGDHAHGDTHSDTESVGDVASAQVSLLKEQLERAEAQLQAKSEEIATLRQETRTANLARWRKEREYNELSVEAKSTARALKRVEERLSIALEGRKTGEQKANTLQNEMDKLKPQYERASKEVDRLKEQLERLQKAHETAQAEVDRSRNDIRKLKSELQYSEKRRLHAEEQEELSSRERAQLRDEVAEIRRQSNDLIQNNKALQEACSLLEEQLTDLEKLADIHEVKNKELESETQRLRAELSSCRTRLAQTERESAERSAAAGLATQQHEEAREQARHAHCQIELLKERVQRGEARIIELEAQTANLEGEYAAAHAALSSAAKRLRDLQEECAELRTRAHEHREHALQLQAALQDAQEEVSASREAAEAATAWWRTRETKADATLRQQAKLIDFLQAKVEEAGRKKCSLSNKLFGRTGRRSAVSPPLRRVNKELREEVERLRTKLATASINGEIFPPTPKRDKSKQNSVFKSIDTPDGTTEDSDLQIVWSDGTRDRVRARIEDGALVWSRGGREMTAQLHTTSASDLPHNEAARAFTVKVENSEKGSQAAVVCANEADRATWMAKLSPVTPTLGYSPAKLAFHATAPDAAMYFGPDAIVLGCPDGLHSLRSSIQLEWSIDCSPPRHTEHITSMVSTGHRALLLCGGVLAHASILALTSAARRSSALKPALAVDTIPLLNGTPHLVKTISSACSDTTDGACAAVACGRRVFLLHFDAAHSEFKIVRSITVDRPPYSLLLTAKALYIAGEKPLRINLPSGALEAFAMEEPMIAAAAKKHSPPKAILLIRFKPLEILLCYAELGVFVDENGKRTRNEDPKWSAAARAWEFVYPFLYVIGDDRVTICYISDETYKSPPCTCDSTSLTSTASEFYMPETFNYKVNEPVLLGTAPNGILIQFKMDDGYSVSIIDGMAAFRSIGASVESLDTVSDTKGSSTDLAQSLPDLSPQDISQESVEPTTDFLADIRNRARQLRMKNRREIVQTSDDVIKEILTTEVGCKRPSRGRKSPATISEFDSDTESEEATESKCTADVCAEMFTRQVRFQ